MKSHVLTALAAALLTVSATSSSGAFDLPKMPGQGQPAPSSGSANAPATPAAVARNARDTLLSFTRAQFGLAQALGGYEGLAEQQKLLEGMQSGDAAAKKDDMQTLVSLDKAANDAIKQKMAENAKLSAENKTLATQSSLEYVKGLIASQRLVASVQSVARNPLALGNDAGTITYVLKELPGIVSGGLSTTGLLFKYLSVNGVDTSEAQKAAQSLGT